MVFRFSKISKIYIRRFSDVRYFDTFSFFRYIDVASFDSLFHCLLYFCATMDLPACCMNESKTNGQNAITDVSCGVMLRWASPFSLLLKGPILGLFFLYVNWFSPKSNAARPEHKGVPLHPEKTWNGAEKWTKSSGHENILVTNIYGGET